METLNVNTIAYNCGTPNFNLWDLITLYLSSYFLLLMSHEGQAIALIIIMFLCVLRSQSEGVMTKMQTGHRKHQWKRTEKNVCLQCNNV